MKRALPELLCIAALAAPLVPQQRGETQVIRALETWLRTYRQGGFEFDGRDISRDSIAIKFGILPTGPIGAFTLAQELELLLEHAARLDNAQAAELVLRVAATGLDRYPYTFAMAPGLVRTLGEVFLDRFTSEEAWERVRSFAQGEDRSLPRALRTAVQAAALRALGRDTSFRQILEAHLVADDVSLRLGAADGLRRMASPRSIESLVRALEEEEEEAVIIAEIDALQASLTNGSGEEQPESATLAVRAVIAVLDRSSWRCDLAAVDFLDRFRSPVSVPALIGVLEELRSRSPSKERRSGLLQHRVHETLVSLTGARIPMDDPEAWQEFWDREGSNLQALPLRPEPEGQGTTSGGFFGIPVRGSRVVFILDVSNSMGDLVPKEETSSGGDATETRLDRAKREILTAVGEIPEDSSFNLFLFSDRISSWSRGLVPATQTNKRRFEQFVAGVNVAAATNLWGGLQEGLEFKSLVYGDHYDSNVDEVFLLSDGAPTVGEVVNPFEILRLIRESYRFNKVRINTVFISSPSDRRARGRAIHRMDPENLMRDIAESTGGIFVSK